MGDTITYLDTIEYTLLYMCEHLYYCPRQSTTRSLVVVTGGGPDDTEYVYFQLRSSIYQGDKVIIKRVYPEIPTHGVVISEDGPHSKDELVS